MVQYFLSGGVLMIPIFLSLFILIFMLLKNIKGAFHIDKIILIGSSTAIFGIIATGLGINGALSVAPDISKIAPHILWIGLKSSLVTTFSGGFILFFSTFLWYFFSAKHKS
ncbi:MAG: hypothetical protein CMG41_00225 [Candidatus Marinimicrobia bacterium]|nr:hypothetical protein [Candidatus Neomarinimicrobiota bacterium]